MAVFKCKMCGGDLKISEGAAVAECEYCGSVQTLPRIDSEKKANLYERASELRCRNEFDKAMTLYESILNEDADDAEAYWSIVLCRYGIEYVEDFATGKRVPTVNRTQLTSIFADPDYKAAIAHADAVQRSVYENEAKAIDEIQRRILDISKKETPFDVFICYKESDESGRRTTDSVIANELYHELTDEGFKVFFSRITLEDKLGQEYEPYIFAALNSAKVMVVLGTKPEYFNAAWVKNEWSRFLALIKGGADKVLVPAYRNMDAYDLPEEFSHLQAQDMSKLGFMQDLIRGIKKLTEAEDETEEEKSAEKGGKGGMAASADALLERAFLFLEDEDWESADEYCERVLDMSPKCAQAYLCKLLAKLKLNKKEYLLGLDEAFLDGDLGKKVLRFADEELKAELLELDEKRRGFVGAVHQLEEEAAFSYENALDKFAEIMGFADEPGKVREYRALVRELIYRLALSSMNRQTLDDYRKAIKLFEGILDYADSTAMADECRRCMDLESDYLAAMRRLNGLVFDTSVGCLDSLNRICDSFYKLGEYKDCEKRYVECRSKLEECKNKLYHEALAIMEQESDKALRFFRALDDYRDSRSKADEAKIRIEKQLRMKDEQTAVRIILVTMALGFLAFVAWIAYILPF